MDGRMMNAGDINTEKLIDKILGELFLEDIIVSSYDVVRAREVINRVLGESRTNDRKGGE
jgi:hypothetical protein